MSDDLSTWADRLEGLLLRQAGPMDRVRVIASTASTQDAAWDACGGRGGLMVTTGRQVRGRGRLGRAWKDERGQGVAVTFVLEACMETWQLSMLAGIAAAKACERFLPGMARTRWPNDVLEPGDRGRKLAGVLIEVREGLALVGIGINVLQQDADWSDGLAARAVSLSQLGSRCSRILLLEALLAEFCGLWTDSPERLIEEWRSREWLVGRRCAIAHDGEQHEGVVRSIDPVGMLVMDTEAGELHLAAASASVVRYD